MAIPDLAPITSAGLLVTDWCPARCRHCYVSAGPDGSRWMSVEEGADRFSALARLGADPAGIHIGGGEPFGDFDRLLAMVRAARRAGLDGVGYVETNAYWATSPEEARTRLVALREAGMRQISLSADPYHQEFVPPERVRLLYEVAHEAIGPGGVRARRWRWLREARDTAAMAEADRTALFRDFLARYAERMTGRAATQLAPLLERRPTDAFAGATCRDELLSSRHVHVDPDGWVYPGTCAGIVLGRATEAQPLDGVLASWRLADWPRVRTLVEQGPEGLLPEAEIHGFRADPAGYASKCHLCWSIRVHLVSSGAGNGVFEPSALYEEAPTPATKEVSR